MNNGVENQQLAPYDSFAILRPTAGSLSHKTFGYCWSTYFHATQSLVRLRIPHVPGPSITVYARPNFRHFGLTNSIRFFFETPLLLTYLWRTFTECCLKNSYHISESHHCKAGEF